MGALVDGLPFTNEGYKKAKSKASLENLVKWPLPIYNA